TDNGLANGQCYRYELETVDRVGNVAVWTSSNEVKVDNVVPTGTITLPPTYVSGTTSFDGTSADGGSGVAGITLSYTGPGTVPSCINPAPSFTPTWSCDIDTTTMDDGTYTLTLVVTDRANNSSVAVTQTVIVDNSPPSLVLLNWSEITNGQFTHPVGSRMYYKSNAAVGATFELDVESLDSSGIAGVDFPALGLGWTPNSVQTITGGSPFSAAFDYAPGASVPGAQSVLSTDNAGNSSTLAIEVVEDNVTPTGSSVTYASATTNAAAIAIDFVVGTDAGSGVDTHQLQRRSAPFSGASCGAWSVLWSNVGTTASTSPFSDTTTADGFCYQYRLVVTDNVQNVETVTSGNEVRIDRTPPTGTINGMPAWIGGTYTLGGTHADDASGVADFDVTVSNTATGDICLAETDASPWACDWPTNMYADGPYLVTLVIRDAATNQSAPITAVVGVDNGPPVLINPVWTEGTSPLNMHAAGPKLWFNPALSGTATLGMTATDAGSGVANVTYPALGTGWTPTLPSSVPFGPYEVTYGFSPTAVTNTAANAVATDNVGNTATRGFAVEADAAAPSGSTISYPSIGYQNTNSIDVTFARGSDGSGSGLNRHQLLRQQTTLLGGTCQAGWTAPANVGALNEPSPYTDGTLADGFCYRYTLHVWDNVNNRETVAELGEVKVDSTVPTGTLDSQPSFVSGLISVTGVHADAGSGVADFDVTFSGPTNGNICAPEVQASPFACAWDTDSGLVPDGLYTIRLVVRDNATNISVPHEIQVTVDNGDPTISFDQWLEGTSPLFQHAVGSTMYYNPTTSGAFTLRMNAGDLGSGVANVTYPSPGAAWTPSAPHIDTSATYDVGYAWSTTSATPAAGLNAVATDNVGNTASAGFAIVPDTTPPTGSSIGYVDTITNGANASVTFTKGTDSQSLVRELHIQRSASPYQADGTCSATFGTWTTMVTDPAISPWVDTTLVGGLCYRYRLDVVDNVSNHEYATSASLVRVDTTLPTGTFDPLPAFVGGMVVVGGTHADDASGVQRFDLTYSGTASGTIACDGLQPSPWSCNWNTLAGGDGPYTLTLTVRDNAGNQSNAITMNVTVDNFPPVIDSVTWTPVGPNTYQFADDTRLWFNPAQSGTARLTVAANDGAGSGVVSAGYPTLGTTWTSGATLVPAPSPFQLDYSWTPTAATALNQPVVVSDFVGNTTTRAVSVEADPDPSTGSSVSYPDGFRNVSSVDITLSRGTDGAGSGIRFHQLQRTSATLTTGTCGAYGGFTDIGGVDTPGTYTDNTIVDGFCYRYRLVVTDNVGNLETVIDAAEVKVDTTDPVGMINPQPAYVTGSHAVTGTHSDAGSGVADFDLTYSGTASGNVCAASTQASPFSCSWDTLSLGLADGPYTLTLLVRDRAGNDSTPVTRNVIVDNSDPIIDGITWVEGASPTTQHAVASKLWISPTGTGTATLKVAAHDVGSGVDRVEYPSVGTGWTPAALASDTTASPDYEQVYSWSGVFDDPSASLPIEQVRVLDRVTPANDAFGTFEIVHDGAAPTGSTIAVVDQFTNDPSIDVTFTVGTDPAGGSGVGRSHLQRRAGTLAGGSCTMPAPGAGWADLGTPNPTSPFVDGALADGTCYEYRLQVWDNVDNREDTVATQQVKVDRTLPTGSFTAPLDGAYVNDIVTFTGTTADVHSGVASFALAYDGANGSGVIACDGLQPSPFTCTWPTNLVIADGLYTITLLVTDVAGNDSLPIEIDVIVDNTPPAVSFNQWTELTGGQFQHAIASTMFYNPLQAGSFMLGMNASDTGSGVNRVEFPALGTTGWTPGVTTSDPSGTPLYENTYTWTANPDVPLDPLAATAIDNVGLSSTAAFRVVPDPAAPTGGSITYPNTPSGTKLTSFDILTTAPTDPLSGLRDTFIQRRSATYSGTTCGVFSTWANVSPINPGATWQDTTTVDGTCYEYQLLATDNVGNQVAFTSANQIRVDRTPPTGTWNVLPTYIGDNFALGGTATDVASGLNTIELFADAGAGFFPIVCDDPTTLFPDPLNPDPDTWSCDWDTTAVTDGAYTLEARITDFANNTGIVTTTVVVDNTPPDATLEGFTEVTNPQYQHATGNTMWYNPGFSGAFDVLVDASDAGAGMDRVDYPSAGAGWTTSPASDTSAPVLPTDPFWTSTYGWTAGPNDNGATPLQAIAWDRTLVNSTPVPFRLRPDLTPPTAGIISYTSGYQNAHSVTLGWSGGTDGESGVSRAQIERRQAALVGDVCGTYGGWGPAGGGNPTNPYVDSTVVSDRCYEYRIVVLDNVENSTVTYAGGAIGSTIVKVDSVAPLGDFGINPTGAVTGDLVDINGTADDVTTAVKRVDVTYSGVDSNGDPLPGGAGTLCSVVGPPEPLTWNCNWATTSVPDGTYTLTMVVTDMADNTYTPATRVLIVDNTPPDADLFAIVEGGSPQYQHVTGSGPTSKLFYNPIQSGGFQVQIDAIDLGTGMNRVTFPDLDGAASTGWTPDSIFDQPLGSASPCGHYCANYTWVNGATVPTSPVQAHAFDNAGALSAVDFEVVADAAPPIGGTIDYSDVWNIGSTAAITFNTGGDLLSGVATWQIERIGAPVSAGVCGAFSTT
ncbi:MAG: hypothetical protein JWO69_1868, partial [Thermoleophilia bacterium]|nr:hypothetical protein [Thermoleophilia bacterium]